MFPDLSYSFETDLLVIGGGAAGLRAAIEAGRRGVRVCLVSSSKAGHANNSAISLGGFNATPFDGQRQDSPSRHYEDTLKGGCGLGRPSLVRILAEEAWGEVQKLEETGVVFRKDSRGAYVRLGRGGHSVARRLATPRDTGMALMAPLLHHALASGLHPVEGVKAVRLLERDGQIGGALLIDREGKGYAVFAKSVILAAGGGGALYPLTTNVPSATGEGYALAYEAGLPLMDMEFVQFVLRTVREPGVPGRLPAVESLLLKGARLADLDGRDLQECAGASFTRDALAQVVAQEISRHAGADFALLDLSPLPAGELALIPGLQKKTLKVYPAVHFFMGGVCADDGMATRVAGLYAAGEAMAGLHGANRLGGNALAEAFVFGARAGRLAAEFALHSGKQSWHAAQAREAAGEMLESASIGRGGDLPALENELKKLAGACCGPIREGDGLEQGLGRLQELERAFSFPARPEPKDLWASFSFRNKLTVAEMILRAALKREETRGAHFRTDFPLQDDRAWAVNLVIEKGDDGRMTLHPEPVPAAGPAFTSSLSAPG